MSKGFVPDSVDAPDVEMFARMFGLDDPPVFLDYTDFGYGPDWCHISAKHRALTEGGKRVHGWALWQYPGLVMGDFHSVWETPEGSLVDVTPPKFGATRVLFARDRRERIEEENGFYMLPVNRTSLQHAPFYWDGKPTEYTIWPLAPANPHLVVYAGTLGIPVTAMPTDDTHG